MNSLIDKDRQEWPDVKATPANERRVFVKQLERWHANQVKEALSLIEAQARALLQAGRAHSFTMCMGGATFYDKEGRPYDDNRKAYAPFYRFLDQCEDCLGVLRGYPMRIDSVDAPTLTDW